MLELFCTNSVEFCVFAIDATFNIFKEKISLTVTTYKNLKRIHKETAKSPVFIIGPILMHQSKDWKTYSKFADSFALERPSLEGILACGTDGEKPLIDCFKRNFRWAIMLRCSIHLKKNIEKTLDDRKYSPLVKREFLRDIFGYQDGETKYTGLMDSDSKEDFDKKLSNLKCRWDEIDGASCSNTFYEWFVKCKIIVCLLFLVTHVLSRKKI